MRRLALDNSHTWRQRRDWLQANALTVRMHHRACITARVFSFCGAAACLVFVYCCQHQKHDALAAASRGVWFMAQGSYYAVQSAAVSKCQRQMHTISIALVLRAAEQFTLCTMLGC